MKKITLLSLLLSSLYLTAQDFGKLEVVMQFPKKMKEISGIEKFENDEIIWAINDSGNLPEVYGFDVSSEKNRPIIKATGMTNIDWEDLATHPNGTLYVGDFGNNDSDRKDLSIYHIETPANLQKMASKPMTTNFQFEGQEKFPPKREDISYDVESFIYLNDHFYLFTRNRAKKYDGCTRIYKVPAKEGEFLAQYIGSIRTCEDQKDCEITSASIHHKTGTIVLLSHNKIWIISEYKNDDFNSGVIKQVKLEHNSQKESVCFKSDNEIYIADERSRGKGRNLYVLKID